MGWFCLHGHRGHGLAFCLCGHRRHGLFLSAWPQRTWAGRVGRVPPGSCDAVIPGKLGGPGTQPQTTLLVLHLLKGCPRTCHPISSEVTVDVSRGVTVDVSPVHLGCFSLESGMFCPTAAPSGCVCVTPGSPLAFLSSQSSSGHSASL